VSICDPPSGSLLFDENETPGLAPARVACRNAGRTLIGFDLARRVCLPIMKAAAVTLDIEVPVRTLAVTRVTLDRRRGRAEAAKRSRSVRNKGESPDQREQGMSTAQELRTHILQTFLFSDDESLLGNDDSFLDRGIIDSTGVLELVMFLEETYSISVADDELVPENLDSVNRLVAFIKRKTKAA
jgi:acyl carrier protein